MTLTRRQTQLVEASCKLIAEKGIQGLTIKNLAAAIEVTEAALYRHFPSKTAIIKAMLEYLTESMSSRLREIVSEKESAIIRLEKVFLSQFAFFVKNPEYVSVVFSEGLFKSNADLTECVLELLHSKKSVLLTLIEQAQKEGTVRKDLSAQDLTHIVMGGFRLLLMKWMLDGYKFPLIEKGKKYWRNIHLLIHME